MKLTFTDSDHRYYLDGDRCASASALAKIPADSFAIEQWQKRMVVTGMTVDPELRERAAVDLDNKELLQTVGEDAMTAAKALSKANRGTQMHRVLERVGRSEFDALITDQQQRDRERIEATLAAHDMTLDPAWLEQFVAYPQHRVTGRFDAVVCQGRKRWLADLKSGANSIRYPHTTLTQLALYRDAPLVSAEVETEGDRSVVTEWRHWPEYVNQDEALVIFIAPDAEVGEIWECDLEYGRRGALIALDVRKWRADREYGRSAVRQMPMSQPARVLGTERPDEGATIDLGPGLEARYRGLSEERRVWVNQLGREAREGGCDFHLKPLHSERRRDLMTAAITLAAHADFAPERAEQELRDLLAAVLETETARWPTVACGYALGRCSASQAALLLQMVAAGWNT